MTALSLSLPSYSGSAGDVLMIQPQNTPAAVDEFLSLFSFNPEQVVSVETTDSSPLPPSLHSPCPLRHLVTHYLDFMSVPRRSFFELLAHFASSERERERLAEFSSTEGQVCSWSCSDLTHTHTLSLSLSPCVCLQEDYYSYCRRPRRTILEVLMDFPSAVGGLEMSYLLELIPALQPRAFSIASSSTVGTVSRESSVPSRGPCRLTQAVYRY